MSVRGWLLGSVGGALGVAAAGTAVGLARQQRAISRRAGRHIEFGSLRSAPVTVVAGDGTPLHVEIDEIDEIDATHEVGPERRKPKNGGSRRRRADRRAPSVTMVFVHGYCLNLDCWHFQRAAYRGLVRSVYYDQRSHGRSGRSDREHCTIEQLGRDLKQVIDHAAPAGYVVLVGHSMGGMSITALVEQYPELIGDRVIGVALISTTAGGLDPSRILLPLLPARLTGRIGGPVTSRAVSALSRGHGLIDRVRRIGRAVATVATDEFAFGDDVPEEYVRFVDDMLSATPFEVVADFFASFGSLDKFDQVEQLGQVPVSIICGTDDKLTSIGHSRKLHQRIPGSGLLECEGAGHMVLMERHDQVNAELDQLLSAATTREVTR